MNKLLFSIFLITLVSCKSTTESTPPQNIGVIMPLSIGNMWAYHDQTFWNAVSGTYDDTMRIVNKFYYGGDTVYANTLGTYYVNRKDGLWAQYYGTSTQDLTAKYPGNPGDIFGHDHLVFTDPSSPDPIDSANADIKIDSVNANVNVLAGNFTCYKYNADYYNASHALLLRQNAYYSVNVGLIKRESFAFDSASHSLKLTEMYQLTGSIIK